ncbi:GID complex subunit containing RING finger motif [Quaeritorhiza haematococci]|nr:GID complex subunit containing RING finger motif [Quaeritorhiza haematococci]
MSSNTANIAGASPAADPTASAASSAPAPAPGPGPGGRTIVNHDGIITLEQPLMQVSLEQFKKAVRTSQKVIDKEMASINNYLNDLSGPKQQLIYQDPGTAQKSLDTILTRLSNLKRKLEDSKTEESLYSQRTRQRLDHLATLTTITSPAEASETFARWNKTRLDRILVDYMLRNGFTETATKVAKDESIEALVDIELFTQARRVEQALLSRSCTECLQWCNENKAPLKKMKSTLEFQLRLQEYIELVRARKTAEAITHARKWLTQWSDTHMKEIQQAMAMLAFGPSTHCVAYRVLFDESRWSYLVSQFRSDLYSLSSLTARPPLTTTLQAGLSSLKTHMCFEQPISNRNVNCPVCVWDDDDKKDTKGKDSSNMDTSDTNGGGSGGAFGVGRMGLGRLAEKLPCAHHVNSCIVCRISGVIMNEDNPPMVLPNGYVYSLNALQEMAAKNNGTIICPRTKAVYHITQLRKAYIS